MRVRDRTWLRGFLRLGLDLGMYRPEADGVHDRIKHLSEGTERTGEGGGPPASGDVIDRAD